MRSAPATPRGGPAAGALLSGSAASTPSPSSSATTPGATSTTNHYYTGLLSPLHQRFSDIEARLKQWRVTFKQLSGTGGRSNNKKFSRRSASHDPNELSTPRRRNKLLLLQNFAEEIDEEGSKTCPVPRKRLQMQFGPPRQRPKLVPVSSPSEPEPLSPEEVNRRFKLIEAKSGQLSIGGQTFHVKFKDLERIEQDGQLGDGASGSVCKYKFQSRPIAVKQMKRTDSVDESKRIFMDLDVISKCRDCRYIVNYYGYFITFDYFYICMELMCTCLGNLLNRRREDRTRNSDSIGLPEEIIGHITLSVVRALDYLKETHKIMHRDVKPSNILMDWFGNVKLCDFGISGKLIESKAITKTGCTGYLAPERVNIDSGGPCTYDVRADVWSLGITLVQLATGKFPYDCIHNPLELMISIRTHDPPRLEPGRFSAEFCQFVADCLQKDMTLRPKFKELLDRPFLQRAASMEQSGAIDVGSWCTSQQGDSEDALTARAQYEAQYGRS